MRPEALANPFASVTLEPDVIGSKHESGGRVERGGAGALWVRFSGSHARTAVVALLGAGVAAAYAHFVGCNTGTCPLTSSVWTASVYGAVVGGTAGWPARVRTR